MSIEKKFRGLNLNVSDTAFDIFNKNQAIFWDELTKFLKEENLEENLGHFGVREEDLLKDLSKIGGADVLSFIAEKCDLIDSFLDNCLSSPENNPHWNKSLSHICELFKELYGEEANVELLDNIHVEDLKDAIAGNNFFNKLNNENDYVVPRKNKTGNYYYSVRENDRIRRVLLNKEKLQCTQEDYHKFVDLLMPMYERSVEVEDLDRNFWVIGQVLAAICAFLFETDSKLNNIFDGILDEIIQIWENLLFLWVAFSIIAQLEIVSTVQPIVIPITGPASTVSKQEVALQRAWNEIKGISDLFSEAITVIIPEIRLNNYYHNYYNKVYYPGAIICNKNEIETINVVVRGTTEEGRESANVQLSGHMNLLKEWIEGRGITFSPKTRYVTAIQGAITELKSIVAAYPDVVTGGSCEEIMILLSNIVGFDEGGQRIVTIEAEIVSLKTIQEKDKIPTFLPFSTQDSEKLIVDLSQEKPSIGKIEYEFPLYFLNKEFNRYFTYDYSSTLKTEKYIYGIRTAAQDIKITPHSEGSKKFYIHFNQFDLMGLSLELKFYDVGEQLYETNNDLIATFSYSLQGNEVNQSLDFETKQKTTPLEIKEINRGFYRGEFASEKNILSPYFNLLKMRNAELSFAKDWMGTVEEYKQQYPTSTMDSQREEDKEVLFNILDKYVSFKEDENFWTANSTFFSNGIALIDGETNSTRSTAPLYWNSEDGFQGNRYDSSDQWKNEVEQYFNSTLDNQNYALHSFIFCVGQRGIPQPSGSGYVKKSTTIDDYKNTFYFPLIKDNDTVNEGTGLLFPRVEPNSTLWTYSGAALSTPAIPERTKVFYPEHSTVSGEIPFTDRLTSRIIPEQEQEWFTINVDTGQRTGTISYLNSPWENWNGNWENIQVGEIQTIISYAEGDLHSQALIMTENGEIFNQENWLLCQVDCGNVSGLRFQTGATSWERGDTPIIEVKQIEKDNVVITDSLLPIHSFNSLSDKEYWLDICTQTAQHVMRMYQGSDTTRKGVLLKDLYNIMCYIFKQSTLPEGGTDFLNWCLNENQHLLPFGTSETVEEYEEVLNKEDIFKSCLFVYWNTSNTIPTWKGRRHPYIEECDIMHDGQTDSNIPIDWEGLLQETLDTRSSSEALANYQRKRLTWEQLHFSLNENDENWYISKPMTNFTCRIYLYGPNGLYARRHYLLDPSYIWTNNELLNYNTGRGGYCDEVKYLGRTVDDIRLDETKNYQVIFNSNKGINYEKYKSVFVGNFKNNDENDYQIRWKEGVN